jgi:hypothetical protein
MKTVISNIPLVRGIEAVYYPVVGNSLLDYKHKVHYPVNAVLAKTIKKGEAVKVLLLVTEGGDKAGEKNVERFKKELDAINKDIGAKIRYENIHMPFSATKDVSGDMFRRIIGKFRKNTEIIADITYGPKPLPMILFCALNFAEKFCGADIKHIVYGKVEFRDKKIVPSTAALYDITSLFYLNSLTRVMECDSAKSAIKLLDEFFNF